MVAVSVSSAVGMYHEKNCFTCENLVKEICTKKGWGIENGFAATVYADTCNFYKKNIEEQPAIIELC